MCFYCVWKYLENTVMIAVRSRYFNEVMFLLLVIYSMECDVWR